MTDPGWYYADGDADGTQRYWDGAQWIGEPVYEPAAPVANPTPGPAMYPPAAASPPPPTYAAPIAAPQGGYVYQQPPPSKFSGSVKPLAIILTVLKAIPLAFALLGVVILGALFEAADDDSFNSGSRLDDFDFAGIFGAAILFLVIIILIGAALLIFQLVGALKEKPLMVFVPAALMSLLDVLATVGSWAGFFDDQGNQFGDPSPGPPVLITAVAVLQVIVAVGAFRAMRSGS